MEGVFINNDAQVTSINFYIRHGAFLTRYPCPTVCLDLSSTSFLV